MSKGIELSFKPDDKGHMPHTIVTEKYLNVTPDFHYWTKAGEKHLIIKAKGLPGPVGKRDHAQRYFSFFRKSGHIGVIVYFVPDLANCLKWRKGVGGGKRDSIRSGRPEGTRNLTGRW